MNKIKKIIEYFDQRYPKPDTALNYSSTFELLVATILSAQTTDKQVNKVTNNLFSEYNSPQDFINLDRGDLENMIKSIGLYKNKSKYIIKTSKKILNDFNGKIPSNRKDLMKLPGVGRKTANVVLTFGFTKNTFPVDTHVFRVANRLKLANSDKVDVVENQLKKNIPEESWKKMHIWLINFGRDLCKARNPNCKKCNLKNICDFYPGN